MGNPPIIKNADFQKALALEQKMQFKAALEIYKDLAESTQEQEVYKEALLKIVEISLNFFEVKLTQESLDKLEGVDLNPHQAARKWALYGLLMSKTGEIGKRLDYTGKGVEICEQNPEECKDLFAYCYYSKGVFVHWGEMREWGEKILEVIEDTSSIEDQVLCYAFIGQANYDDLEKAFLWFKKARILAVEKVQFPGYLLSIISLYECRINAFHSKSREAINNALEAEKYYLECQGDFPLSFVTGGYRFLSVCYANIEEFYESILYAQKALALDEKFNRQLGYSNYEILGWAYAKINKPVWALKYINKALKILRQKEGWDSYKNPYLHNTYRRLGEIYANIDSETAEEYFLKSIETLDKQGADLLTYIGSWSGLAEINKNEKGLAYAKKIVKESNNNCSVYCVIGKNYLYLNRLEEAIEAYSESLNQNTIGSQFEVSNETLIYKFSNYVDAMKALNGLGKTYFFKYKFDNEPFYLDQSIAYFDYAFKLSSWMRNGYSEQSRILFNNELTNSYEWYLKALTHQKTIDYNKVIQIFEASKSDTLHQSLVEKRMQKKFEGIPAVKEERERKLKIQQLERQLERLEEGGEQNALYETLFDERKSLERFITSIEEKYPVYFESKYKSDIVDLEAIQKALPDRGKIINYFLGDSEIFILIVNQEEVELMVVPKPADLGEAIKSLYNDILFINASAKQKAQQLYTYLVLPISDLLLDNLLGEISISDLTIIPHGILFQIPFDALFYDYNEAIFNNTISNKTMPNYLVNDFDISYHYSFALWLEAQKNKPNISDLSFLGLAPVYDMPSANTKDSVEDVLPAPGASQPQVAATRINMVSSQADNLLTDNRINWNPLPYSEKEVNTIAQMFEANGGEAVALIRESASVFNLLKHLEDFNIIHAAAHYQQHEVPQKSGLVLGDGKHVYVGDAYSYDLKTQLIVLNACKSGIGQVSKSEGMMAMSRAFLFAGVENIITTLFEINDEQAGVFMELFYKEILAGKSIKFSLNNAKRVFLKQEENSIRIWSAFTLFG